jgi:glycosyltransferase involved in cell wall biosynthesis
MSDAPEVSIVIPTRDRARLLRRALGGALGQRDVDVEVIVVDDGSAEPVESVGDPRVRIVRQEESRGVACARNTGIAAARGRWVAFLDDDDLWAPRKLRLQLDAAETKGVSFVFGAGVMVDEKLRVLRTFEPPDPECLAETLGSVNAIPFGCSNVVARADLLRSVRGFDEHLFQLADWDLWYRLAAVAVAAATREVVVAYVMHPANMLLTHEPDVMVELDYFAAKVAADADDLPRVDAVRFSRWVAGGHLRAGRKRRAAGALLSTGFAHRNLGNVLRGLAAPAGERGMFAYWRLTSGQPPAPKWLDAYRSTLEVSPVSEGASTRP